jgi:predicted RNA-binding protein with PIN domain
MSQFESPTGLQPVEDREDLEVGAHPDDSHAPARPKRGSAFGSFARGALEAVWITALFAALGLGYAELLRGAPPGPAVYAPSLVTTRSAEDPSIWLVDGFNVVQRTLLGGRERDEWWTERRRAELLERAARFDDNAAEIWVVFDGHGAERDESDAPGPHRVFAPSADDWLLARVRAAENPGRIAVVTADRRLAERARRRGARVVGPGEFLRRCTGDEPAAPRSRGA